MFSSGAFALDLDNPLPNWIDGSREKADGKPPVILPTVRGATPSDFRIPAEYEPVGAVVLGWAGYTGMLGDIARAASGQGGAQVWALSGPTDISGVSNYTKITARIDTVWVRDYGPFGLSAGEGRPGIVDSIYRHYQYRRYDDAAPVMLGRIKGIGVYGMPVIMDGGNLMVDSYGNLFHTERTYMWNYKMSREEVDNHLKNYLKVKNIITFEYSGYPGEPEDGTGHIDMFMKLLNDHTVLIAVADTEPFKSNSEKAIKYFEGRRAPDGQMYKVIKVKGWERYGTWYTYTNSLLVNSVAIIPSYSGHGEEEAAARAAYQSAGYTVAPVNSDYSIRAGGSIHCVTQTIPVLPGRNLSATDMPEFRDVEMTAPVIPLKDAGGSTSLQQLLDSI